MENKIRITNVSALEINDKRNKKYVTQKAYKRLLLLKEIVLTSNYSLKGMLVNPQRQVNSLGKSGIHKVWCKDCDYVLLEEARGSP